MNAKPNDANNFKNNCGGRDKTLCGIIDKVVLIHVIYIHETVCSKKITVVPAFDRPSTCVPDNMELVHIDALRLFERQSETIIDYSYYRSVPSDMLGRQMVSYHESVYK